MPKEEVLLTPSQVEKVSENCDPWHVHGNVKIHGTDRWEDNFEAKLKEKLPQMKLPVRIGVTGYPETTRPVRECPKRGWCLDEAQRFTAFLDGKWMFRRYTSGGPMMFNSLENPANDMMTEEKAEELLRLL